MREYASLDHELRDKLLRELLPRLQSVSFYPNLLNMGEFTVHSDVSMGWIELRVSHQVFGGFDYSIVKLSYKVVPKPEVTISVSHNGAMYYLTETGQVSPTAPYLWPGASVTVEWLWSRMLVCGLGLIRNRRGGNDIFCDLCPHQFQCLAAKPAKSVRTHFLGKVTIISSPVAKDNLSEVLMRLANANS